MIAFSSDNDIGIPQAQHLGRVVGKDTAHFLATLHRRHTLANAFTVTITIVQGTSDIPW